MLRARSVFWALALGVACRPPRTAPAKKVESGPAVERMIPPESRELLSRMSGASLQLSSLRTPLEGEGSAEFSYDFLLSSLTPESCATLWRALSAPAEAPSNPCGESMPEIRASRLLSPVLQALIGHRWERTPELWDGVRVEFVATALSTAYEVLRHRNATADSPRWTVFFAPPRNILSLFHDDALFSLRAELPMDDAASLFSGETAAEPGDLVEIVGSEVLHAGVVVIPGVIFDKFGPADAPGFRLTTAIEFVKPWSEGVKLMVRRSTGAPLPDPWEHFSTRRLSAGAVTEVDDGGERRSFGMVRLPVPEEGRDGYELRGL